MFSLKTGYVSGRTTFHMCVNERVRVCVCVCPQKHMRNLNTESHTLHLTRIYVIINHSVV